MSILGIFGRPFLDLEPYIDCSELEAIDEEICLGLTRVRTQYTGGSHKWMGIVPPSLERDPFVDYGQVIDRFSREEFIRFASLSDTPHAFDFDPDRRREYEFGEERDFPLSKRQILYLKFRHGVYFPWKVFYELMPGGRWEEKANPSGKAFTAEALRFFPRTVAFVQKLPFRHVGRCNLLGLEANDHGTVHRDGEPDEKPAPDHFITFMPRAGKRLFLWDEEQRTKHFVRSRIYWFNDSSYHGVAADPFFRYSIRVDGEFDPAFLARLERDVTGRSSQGREAQSGAR